MKTGIKTVAIFFLSCIIFNATSQQVTYSGPIEYEFIRTKRANGSGSNGYNWNVDIDEKYIIKGTFYVVFTAMGSPAGFTMCHMTSSQEKIHFENWIKNEAFEERISQGCSDDLNKRTRTVSPGDSRIYKQTVNHVRLNPEKTCIGRGVMTITSPKSTGNKESSGGKYSVMLGGGIETEMTSEVYSEQKYACNPNRNKPPDVVSQTFNMPIPVSIIFEEDFDGSDVLTGKQVTLDNHGTDCSPGGPYANMAHGDVDCAFDESITVSWTLIKRTEECDANLSSIKGDVKINGAPVKNGNIKIGAGDMISTGGKSRVRVALPDGSLMAVGSKSSFILGDPCNLGPPSESRENPVRAWLRAVNWKIGVVLGVKRGFEIRTGTAVVGVRGQVAPKRKYNTPDDNNLEIRSGPHPGFYIEEIEIDPEKESIIKEMGNLSGSRTALYIHSDSEGVHDVSAIKGDIVIESAARSVRMVVKEGTTVTSWPDGSPFAEIYIRQK